MKKEQKIQNWERTQEYNSIELDYSLIDNIEVEGIDHRDAPDFCDAFIAAADYDGRPMTENELEKLNEDGDFRYQAVIDSLY